MVLTILRWSEQNLGPMIRHVANTGNFNVGHRQADSPLGRMDGKGRMGVRKRYERLIPLVVGTITRRRIQFPSLRKRIGGRPLLHRQMIGIRWREVGWSVGNR